jgi:uncharacterized SAM-binding protein YcdF (DUF218 family)
VRILYGLAALLAVWLVVAAVLFVFPREDSVTRADAIVVLAGGKKERLGKALDLVDDGVSRTLVISDGRDPGWPEANRLCDGARSELTVICFRPDPYSTRGEAEAVARMAGERGWRHVAVVTSTFHVFRARMLFDRCIDSEVDVVGASYPLIFLPRQIVFETLKLSYALTFGRSC